MNKRIKYLVISLFLVAIFVKQNNTIDDIYYIYKHQPHERLIKSYRNLFYSGYCDEQSHGYIIYVKKKFDLEQIPLIKNFQEGKRIPYWIFEKVNYQSEINDENLILLNYEKRKKKDEIDFSNYTILDNYYNRCYYLKKND